MADEGKKGNEKSTTLAEEQIGAASTGRRSFLTAVGIATTGAAASTLTGCWGSGYYVARPVARVYVPPPPQVVVGTPGVVVQGGGGACAYRTNLTDSDGGAYADPAGCGRGTARLGRTGITDSDGGPYADPAGQGRGQWGRAGWSSGITDSDSGAGGCSDPGGNGRGPQRGIATGFTDGDAGQQADPAGAGRGFCRR